MKGQPIHRSVETPQGGERVRHRGGGHCAEQSVCGLQPAARHQVLRLPDLLLATALTTKERPAQCQGIDDEAGPPEVSGARRVRWWSEVSGDRGVAPETKSLFGGQLRRGTRGRHRGIRLSLFLHSPPRAGSSLFMF